MISFSGFEGELMLGIKNAAAVQPKQKRADVNNQITAQAAIGIDSTSPTNNYFYGKINKFTLDAISKAFGLNIKLPKVLMETGFPEEVLVSFTLSPKGMLYCLL